MKNLSKIVISLIIVVIIILSAIGFFIYFNKGAKNENTNMVSENVSVQTIEEQEEGLIKKEDSVPILFNIFGEITLAPDKLLKGSGKNIDSPEFWTNPETTETYLFASAKSNKLIEIFKSPFDSTDSSSLEVPNKINGLDIDYGKNWLLVGNTGKDQVDIYSLPDYKLIKSIGQDILGSGETNMDTLTMKNGQKIAYISESHLVKGFNLETGNLLYTIDPKTDGIEEILADDYYEVIYIPEESGTASPIYPKGAILAFNPDGSPYLKDGTNIFGTGGFFTKDEEGIALYKCLKDKDDTGEGFIIAVNQDGGNKNSFEFFNRRTWKHLGSFKLEGVSGTDGIGSIQDNIPGYPDGILAATSKDEAVAIIGWDKIFEATGLRCGDNAVQ